MPRGGSGPSDARVSRAPSRCGPPLRACRPPAETRERRRQTSHAHGEQQHAPCIPGVGGPGAAPVAACHAAGVRCAPPALRGTHGAARLHVLRAAPTLTVVPPCGLGGGRSRSSAGGTSRDGATFGLAVVRRDAELGVLLRSRPERGLGRPRASGRRCSSRGACGSPARRAAAAGRTPTRLMSGSS